MALPASPVVGAGAACLWGGCGNGHQLRSVLIDGEPWFVAADACRCLGLRNVTMATGTLTDDEKGFKTFDTLGGSQKMRVISRPGLFKLIQRSSKPEAKEFDRWVRHEVLPQVMDNGGYMLPLSPSQPPPKPPLSRPTAGQLGGGGCPAPDLTSAL